MPSPSTQESGTYPPPDTDPTNQNLGKIPTPRYRGLGFAGILELAVKSNPENVAEDDLANNNNNLNNLNNSISQQQSFRSRKSLQAMTSSIQQQQQNTLSLNINSPISMSPHANKVGGSEIFKSDNSLSPTKNSSPKSGRSRGGRGKENKLIIQLENKLKALNESLLKERNLVKKKEQEIGKCKEKQNLCQQEMRKAQFQVALSRRERELEKQACMIVDERKTKVLKKLLMSKKKLIQDNVMDSQSVYWNNTIVENELSKKILKERGVDLKQVNQEEVMRNMVERIRELEQQNSNENKNFTTNDYTNSMNDSADKRLNIIKDESDVLQTPSLNNNSRPGSAHFQFRNHKQYTNRPISAVSQMTMTSQQSDGLSQTAGFGSPILRPNFLDPQFGITRKLTKGGMELSGSNILPNYRPLSATRPPNQDYLGSKVVTKGKLTPSQGRIRPQQTNPPAPSQGRIRPQTAGAIYKSRTQQHQQQSLQQIDSQLIRKQAVADPGWGGAEILYNENTGDMKAVMDLELSEEQVEKRRKELQEEKENIIKFTSSSPDKKNLKSDQYQNPNVLDLIDNDEQFAFYLDNINGSGIFNEVNQNLKDSIIAKNNNIMGMGIQNEAQHLQSTSTRLPSSRSAIHSAMSKSSSQVRLESLATSLSFVPLVNDDKTDTFLQEFLKMIDQPIQSEQGYRARQAELEAKIMVLEDEVNELRGLGEEKDNRIEQQELKIEELIEKNDGYKSSLQRLIDQSKKEDQENQRTRRCLDSSREEGKQVNIILEQLKLELQDEKEKYRLLNIQTKKRIMDLEGQLSKEKNEKKEKEEELKLCKINETVLEDWRQRSSEYFREQYDYEAAKIKHLCDNTKKLHNQLMERNKGIEKENLIRRGMINNQGIKKERGVRERGVEYSTNLKSHVNSGALRV